MYRDLGNKIKFIKIKRSSDWWDHIKFIDSFKNIFTTDDHIKIGYEYLQKTDLAFDKAFYDQMKIPFSERFSRFYFERDNGREMKLFNQFDIKENEYVLIHEGGSNGNMMIDRSKVNTYLREIKVEPLTPIIFDYCYIIQRAAEVHCIDSGFLFVADAVETTAKLFLHTYNKKNVAIPTLQKKWIIL
jgi:hypothetical protein